MTERTNENDVRDRIGEQIAKAQRQAPDLRKLLDVVNGLKWVALMPEPSSYDAESTGDANSYLAMYQYQRRL